MLKHCTVQPSPGCADLCQGCKQMVSPRDSDMPCQVSLEGTAVNLERVSWDGHDLPRGDLVGRDFAEVCDHFELKG